MRYRGFVRWSGAAAFVGGLLWAAGAVLRSMEPRGCVGAECLSRSMRDPTLPVTILFTFALALIGAGTLGLILLARGTGSFTKMGKVGVACGIAGLTVLAAGVLIQGILEGDFPLMPMFVVPGVVACIAGIVLVGITVLKAALLPRWLAAILIVSAALMLGANDQTAAVLLIIPFGLVWLPIGYVLWAQKDAADFGLAGSAA